jgi:hypothetical protein
MNGGVVYAAWPGGAVAVDRDGQAASSRTPIDRRADCGCARWHALVALYRDAVGWAQLHGGGRKRWRCGVRQREDSAGEWAAEGMLYRGWCGVRGRRWAPTMVWWLGVTANDWRDQ